MPCIAAIGLVTKEEVDRVTDMLCRTLDIVFENSQYTDVDNPIPVDVREWYLKHKKWDAERMKK